MIAFMADWKLNFMFFVKSYLISTFLSHVKSLLKVRSEAVSPVPVFVKSRIFRWLKVRCMLVLKAHDCGR